MNDTVDRCLRDIAELFDRVKALEARPKPLPPPIAQTTVDDGSTRALDTVVAVAVTLMATGAGAVLWTIALNGISVTFK